LNVTQPEDRQPYIQQDGRATNLEKDQVRPVYCEKRFRISHFRPN
jgi:hypothetical protein